MPKSTISYKICDLSCWEVVEKLSRSCWARERARERGQNTTLCDTFFVTVGFSQRGFHREFFTESFSQRGFHWEVFTERFSQRGFHREVFTGRFSQGGFHWEVCFQWNSTLHLSKHNEFIRNCRNHTPHLQRQGSVYPQLPVCEEKFIRNCRYHAPHFNFPWTQNLRYFLLI